MGTITVNINDEIEKEFKAIANITHKDKKEYLETAIPVLNRIICSQTHRFYKIRKH